MSTLKKIIVGVALTITVIFGYLIYFQNTPLTQLPPELVIVDEYYASSTNELVVVWEVKNDPDLSIYNTGIRYDTVSHTMTTPTSETYASVVLPATVNSEGYFEAHADFGEAGEIFYRIQTKTTLPDSEFLWSEERSVKKIDLTSDEVINNEQGTAVE